MTTLPTRRDCETSDAVVIAASLSSPAEFAAIFDRHFVTVHRYLSRRVGQSVADDLASETFTVALGRLASYDTSYPSARPWLLGIATNLIRSSRRDEIRLLKALERTRVVDAVDQADDFATVVSARVSAQATAGALAHALVALSGGDRDVLLMYAWGGLTYDDIATWYAIPVGTVRSRLHRSRAQLRRSLADSGITTADLEVADAAQPPRPPVPLNLASTVTSTQTELHHG